ncbi:hypothetical protein [Parasutterella sp.]|uniref:hypothetical protein n=1 Tax=Parasutterella sp. TaxID=2049037 RepID=UPI003995A905
MEQGNTDRLLEVLADLGYGSVEEFFDYFPYDKIFNELWQGELEANSLTEIAFAAHISAQYAMQFAPTFTKVEEFMRGDNEINAEVYNFANFLGFASGALYAVTDLLRADMTDVKAVVDEQSPYMRSLFYQCLVFLSHLKAVYQDLVGGSQSVPPKSRGKHRPAVPLSLVLKGDDVSYIRNFMQRHQALNLHDENPDYRMVVECAFEEYQEAFIKGYATQEDVQFVAVLAITMTLTAKHLFLKLGDGAPYLAAADLGRIYSISQSTVAATNRILLQKLE